MNDSEKIRIALIGTASRGAYMYAPILQQMGQECSLVALWGRSAESASKRSRELGVPWYTDMDKLVRETQPDIAIVTVNHAANGQVALMALEAGLNVLVETPVSENLHEAKKILQIANEKGLKVEVSEQFYRRPVEQIKLKLIKSGIFGKVFTSFNDFGGHGYHGVSLMRSYLGFEQKPVKVIGLTKNDMTMPHRSRIADTWNSRKETQEYGIIEFESGQTGIFCWSDLCYDSALRWWRSSRFFAEKGMGISVSNGQNNTELLSLLSPDSDAPAFITLERRFERVDGGMLEAMIAHTNNKDIPCVRWNNPFFRRYAEHSPQWHDDEIGVASCILSIINAVKNDSPVDYGVEQAMLDQEIISAIRLSSENGSIPVSLPLM